MFLNFLLIFWNMLPFYLYYFTVKREIIKEILEKAVAEHKFAALV